MGPTGPIRLIGLIGLISLLSLTAHAQIKVGGNVYGGGNHAEVRGSSKVTVMAGDLQKVFGGARMANVKGHTFVNIDGENATDETTIVAVYGGSDISGTIGTPKAVGESRPSELTDVIATEEERASVTPAARKPYMNVIDDTWNCYVRTSRSTQVVGGKTVEKWPIVIGMIFGGGNGDFTYTGDDGPLRDEDGNYIAMEGDEVVAVSATPLSVPEIDKTYLELKGGEICHAYGGGNNATVRENTTLNIANESSDLVTMATQYLTDKEKEVTPTSVADQLTYFKDKVKLKSLQIDLGGNFAYNFARVYGGNNRAEMAIRPTWNLQQGIIRDLYSGGNRGNMTSPDGLLLDVNPEVDENLYVENVYGGCRMADVKPTVNGEYVPCTNLPGYNFPGELSARTLINGGHIVNVYGGNDITGTVYGGNAVGIHTTVYGDVYGGGNGAYPYTDFTAKYQNDDIYGDYCFNGGNNTMNSLKAFRPNAEQVSLHLLGESKTNPTVIHGSVFVGGNCASLAVKKSQPLVELKIGSHVIADNVYLGNNGEGMVSKFTLEKCAEEGFNSLTLTDHTEFEGYMDAVAMTLMPKIVFDSKADGDRNNYEEYSSYIGSFFCGGNVGSMAIPGKMTFNLNHGLNIYNKFVGGCNNADIPAQDGLNAAYNGGIIGSEEERDNYTDEAGNIMDRLEINFQNMTVLPRRWNDTFVEITVDDLTADGKLKEGQEYYTSNLQDTKFIADGTEVVNLEADDKYYKKTGIGNIFEWNTGKYSTDEDEFKGVARNPEDKDIRLLNGNIYGGCYNSGHVNGNVVINIKDDVVKKDEIFGTGTSTFYGYEKSGVDFEGQRDDVMTSALYVYGAGHGKDTEIWGSTTINHNNGYAFQLFGGGEQGAVGKRQLNDDGTPVLDTDGNYIYTFDPKYSTTVNLNGTTPIYSHEGTVESLAEAEYLYGGGNEGIIAGNTLVNLGNGRIYDVFGGSSDADILGHAEVFVGRQPNGSGGYKDGFPWLRDNVYGGNDFGGTIHGTYEEGFDFTSRVRDYENDKTQIYGYKANAIPEVLKSSSYVEYLQGRVDSIFGGGYGSYNYANTELYGTGCSMPKQESAFVNIRPKDHAQNYILGVYGAGTGYPGVREDDVAQDRSYVLVDIPDGMTNFGNTEVFGAGSYNGIGMKYTPAETFAENFNLDKASAVIDLLRGRIHNAYGGSYQEGITRRTVVNVPTESSIQIDNIFGGAYGVYILPPCDVYETQVNYKNTSEKAQVFGAIYGGNNNERRSLFTQVNISSPVYSNKEKGYTSTVYGAGRGIDTWSEHTEVNLLSGARVYNVYGGGEMGHVLNSASVQAYMNLYKNNLSPQISEQDPFWKSTEGGEKYTIDGNNNRVPKPEYVDRWHEDWANAWTMGKYYIPGKTNEETPETAYSKYATHTHTSLAHFSDRPELDDKTAAQLDGAKKHNTNVIVNKGAIVEGYAYGGGLGDASVAQTGDIYGSTYIAVLGGEVKKDVYAGGRAGGVDNLFGATDFTVSSNKFVATANAYIQGGTARNVYGGGYEGHVGHHDGAITTTTAGDRPAEAYVVIGKQGTNTFDGGAPAITRNVYGGGEGGSVYGSSEVTVNNGYIGYRYKSNETNGTYVEELDDQKPGDLELSGNVFGGGYVVNSYVDSTTINMYGGTVRGSLYGGGEIGPIGRGTMLMSESQATGAGGKYNQGASIFRAGTTNVNMFDGKVKRNVFGGGRGKDSWGGDGTMYMDPAVVATLDMKCKGFVFGQTHVNIHGGEIGTAEGMAYGYGNVFGGGDEGSVYSAYTDKFGALQIGAKSGTRYDKNKEGYYYNGSKLTEDCKVVVEPWAKAFVDISVGGTSYKKDDYVKTENLNKLKGKNPDTGEWESSEWGSLDDHGIIIHNAVFAGGNLASGSSSLFANAKTVYGNATASIHDAYNRDLITIGTGHTGGLYGDGNLTFVDGYRELNITNYGTDYHHIKKQLTYDDYLELPTREQAYYELKYSVKEGKGPIVDEINGTTYNDGSSLPQDEIIALFDGTIYLKDGKPNSEYWEESGVVTVYAGRIMNTIQRADFCGVFGSRMVMKGAQDRVPEEADYTNYTINRVREVSLNKKTTTAGDTDNENKEHGNYFGIYSVVNYLGALTSDVNFGDDEPNTQTEGKWKYDVRTHENKNKALYDPDYDPTHTTVSLKEGLEPDEKTAALAAAAAIDGVTVEGETITTSSVEALYKLRSVQGLKVNGERLINQTYYEWKKVHHKERKRNNGSCHNQLALASGVYLELTSEEKPGGTTVEAKEWGPITGVVELDLINVQPGIGGGFVYAKNEHGKRSPSGITNTTLTDLNDGAASQKYYKYEPADNDRYEWETSGNFIHSTQTIIDDCYNISNSYLSTNFVKAHYWYIAGSVFVYDQYISAYTGSPNAFSETVEIPISISAASNGTMTLLDVQPNYYAYYKSTNTPLSGDQKLVIGDVTYQLNDPISYWDYNKLSAAEKNLFVNDTYVTSAGCKIGNDTIYAGTVMRLADYNTYYGSAETQTIDEKKVKAVFSNGKYVPFEEIFHSSNNLSHNTGYLLTYGVTNPDIWNKWYTKKESVNREKAQGKKDDANYESGPTYHPETDGLYGQQDYDVNAIIPEKIYSDYQALTNKPAEDQAIFEEAYLVTEEYTSSSMHYYPNAPISKTTKEGIGEAKTAPAFVSTATIQLSATEYIYVNDLMTAAQKNKYKSDYSSLAADIEAVVKPAYICTTAGKYGGSYYYAQNNYRALDAYSAMSPKDRAKFKFNYDALDLLIDSLYSRPEGKKYQYDGEGYTTPDQAINNPATYSLPTPIDYTATYNGTAIDLPAGVSVNIIGLKDPVTALNTNNELMSTEFEKLPNEQRHYTPIAVAAAGGEYHVVKNTFIHGYEAFAVGTTIDDDKYEELSDYEQEQYITTLTFTNVGKDQTYYYCRELEGYKIGEKVEGVAVNSAANVTGATGGNYVIGDVVPQGVVIDATQYGKLPNYQKNFTIHGTSPTETSTLYVARNADINDLSTEKIITVIYKYDYEESDESGEHITPVTERHVVNIHINFKSGVPTVEDINPPTIVLPGTGITMRVPSVTPGAYEVTGGGWELFDNPDDAESHINGVPYTPSVDPLYWYQDGFYLAYYAKTYLGKTYSNHVPVSVANYHDLKRVMDDKTTHLHVDYDRTRLKRDSKIYINDYSANSENGLDLFKDLYDLSLLNSSSTGVTDDVVTSEGRLKGHHILNQKNGPIEGENLEFILRTDIDHSMLNPAYNPEDPTSPERIPAPWTTIGTDAKCFKGNLHGDGHTISSLDNSLFYNLCGNVYNLGVTGSFNTAGVADKGNGYIESAWVKTTATEATETKPYAVFGAPSDGTGYQVVNSYFWDGNNNLYNTTEDGTSGGDRGKSRAMTAQEFYNGTVAYNLNNFYLYKRYNDGKGISSGTDYKYWKQGESKLEMQTGYYANNAEQCSSGWVDAAENAIKYVEERFADGDFVFAAGEIPTAENERFYSWTVKNPETNAETVMSSYFPIWPDDYIFFGQKLTYGWAAETHQNVPTAVVREDGRLSTSSNANRVYRAPTYYRSKEMDMAHFNPQVYLAQKERLTTEQIEAHVTAREAYPNMTAIDFKGHYETKPAYGEYGLGNEKGLFYTPLLDDDGLLSIQNCDETQNLVVYSPSSDANAKTHGVLNGYFTEPIYVEDNTNGYRLVAEASAASVHGHLVQYNKIADRDHLLVDKQDFNAPIAYNFDADHLMWYQRIPADKDYVDFTKGWQGISIPFTAELVTTNQKGEITHFYGGSYESYNETKTKRGHEYWLREYKKIEASVDPAIAKATFNYPSATGPGKTVTNTFLWDYYYQNTNYHNQLDMNADTYEQDRHYYENSRSYSGYSKLAAATPYILGLPGETYYEFDLSGNFRAQNTAVNIPQLGKQIITFASDKGAGIRVSDDEMAGVTVKYGETNYTFKTSYMNEALEASTNNYALNAAGNSFDKVTETTNVSAFRPYFTAAAVSGSGNSRSFFAKRIIFGGTDNDLREGPETVLDGSLEIYTRGYNIVTTSHMKEATTIRIITAAGAIFSDYVLQPGETIETTVPNTGVYVVNKKKVFIE